ncbi:50S ribosomal protein L10 [Candidatus Woesebacteria bacterium RIFOXYA1_FULL_40_18]|uniref:Large ribosomal subunit protein uL10 n=3 Tax=Candidatus Woeseibacteriota TaxID=1752722 RepID=A0A1F8CIH7_9BACT|nr:MAG: 50S ribosomal protein L10 [Candidatus Woesebacteria bacterium RIFOXYA1_FULL_40_18]OGM80493.1 MAG: 50S ribosomal protein L10 [Candidatus Woesebacteria bacterium RIFOXYB1_FULL_40_26]OGM87473.1 MAG: 50S ribosomal protein L10 [Candidatus Woesebacteria bacterium RIFOXYD1_FULL_40_21]
MKKQEKIFFVENLTEELKSAKLVVLINYAGLTVKAQQELKRRLAEVGASMLVVKNTLLKRAGEAADIDKEVLTDTVLSGQTALVIAKEDALAPVGILGKFAKEFEVPQFKVGVVEGNFQNSEALAKLSSLPSKDALLGQLLGVLMAPNYGLVQTLSGNMQKLVYILNQKSKG